MVLSTEYPLDRNIQATSEIERRPEGVYSSIIDRVNAILGYDVSMVLIDRYAKLATRTVSLRRLENDELFAEIQSMPGVWASGSSEADVLKELKEVVEDWVILKIQDGDKDLPVIDGLNLNVL